jgi:hypothetical protein
MPYRQIGMADERGIRVAFLSRRALHGRVDIRPFPAGFLPIQVGDDPARLASDSLMQVTVTGCGISLPSFRQSDASPVCTEADQS